MRTRLARRLFLALPLLLLGALGWHTYRQVRQAKLDNELRHAVGLQDVAGVRLALAHGANPSARDVGYSPPFDWRRPWTVLPIGRPGSSGARGMTLLTQAITAPDRASALALLEGGADICADDEDGRVPLIAAIVVKDPQLVAALLDRGARPNSTDGRGWSPLMSAVEARCPAAVLLLIERGADPTRRSAYGNTALSMAIEAGQADVAARIRQAEADWRRKRPAAGAQGGH